MNYCFVLAGVPSQIYDQVYRERKKFCKNDAEFLGRCLKKNGEPFYSKSDFDFFIKEVAERFRKDHHNTLAKTKFVCFYIDYSNETSRKLFESLHPAVFCVPIKWNYDLSTKHRANASVNELLNILEKKSDIIRKSLPSLTHEMSSRDSKTTLLLPVASFKSKVLRRALESLVDNINQENDANTSIDEANSFVLKAHPIRKSQGKGGFLDDRNIQFHPPGAARHGYARDSAGHLAICLVSGRRRLGVPYDRAFHYDCTRGEKPLIDDFPGCHPPEARHHGAPHLNISPNDHVR
ncbi:hypothetical protein [Delftia lacustris]|uniref:hypothetical protein n=1 Tax=Delftia lacustris TaxID=558537 RepID=UPI0035A5AB7E